MSILFAILALGLLIVLHELGHFLVARWCGMCVYEFSVGFGPRLWHVKYGETEYSLRAIFLGGYVRVAGMHPAEEDAQDPRSFLQSSPGKRFAMIFAGPLANYLTAFVVFLLLYGIWGIRDNRLRVGAVAPGTWAAQATFQPGDVIIAVDGKPLRGRPALSPLEQLRRAFAERKKQSIALTLLRQGKRYEVTIPRKHEQEKAEMGLRIESWERVSVKSLRTQTLAHQRGMEAGDIVTLVEGKALRGVADLRKILLQRKRRDVSLSLERRGKTVVVVLPKDETTTSDDIGLSWAVKPIVRVTQVKAGSLAQAYGLQEGDLLVGLQQKPLRSIRGRSPEQQLQHLLSRCGTSKQPMQVQLLRQNQKITIRVSADAKGKCGEGFSWLPTSWILVMQVQPKSTAAALGLRSGDRLLSVDKQPLVQLEGGPFGSIHPLLSLLQARLHRTVQLELERQGKRLTYTVPIAALNAQGEINYLLGFQPQIDYPRRAVGVLDIVKKAGMETWLWNVRIWDGLTRIFSGEQKANFTGPVGIVQMTQNSVRQGAKYFLFFIAIISIHLAFFNLLPIPALDGGRLMFLFSQQLIRLFGGKEEWAVKAEMVANVVGFLLLFGLLLFITFKDIQKLF